MKLSMILVLIGLTALTACNKPSGNSTETRKQSQFYVVSQGYSADYSLTVVHDDVNHVTCWIIAYTNATPCGASCLPDSALSPAKPAASSAPKAE